MSNNKLVVVGSGNMTGITKAELMAKLVAEGHNDIIVIDNNDLTTERIKEVFNNLESCFKPEPFIITNPYPLNGYTNEKQFICKGKHRYIETKTEQKDGSILVEWICQCGTKTK